MPLHFLIVGAGFSGSVLARELAENLDCHIEIWEERKHIAGNCFTSEDAETGIMVHRYGRIFLIPMTKISGSISTATVN